MISNQSFIQAAHTENPDPRLWTWITKIKFKKPRTYESISCMAENFIDSDFAKTGVVGT